MAYNEKQKEYTMNYLDKLKEIRFRVKPEEFERYEKAAKKSRISKHETILFGCDQ